jgi:alanyl-tRNA synthetase
MTLDRTRRTAIRANHSATHLLHAALHRIIGEHVTQKGSMVGPDRLRFDVNLNQPLTQEQIDSIEQMVNEEIWANTPVSTRLMPVDEAMEAGAMALFGEKYDDEVRVLTMGRDDASTGKPYSTELCGGTHVQRTGDIGLFKLTGDSALSAGVRRIEGVTRAGALAMLSREDALLRDVAGSLNVAISDIPTRVRVLADEKRKLEKQMAELRRQMATGGGAQNAAPDFQDIDGVKFSAKILEDFPPRDLRPMADDLKKQIGSGVVALVATNDGKASIVVGVTSDLSGRISAVDLVKLGAQALGGQGGGGRPDMAQAGGPDAGNARSAVSAIEKALAG